MSDQDYIVIGSFVVGNLGTIFGLFKWYLNKEVALAERLVRIENDIDGIAKVIGTKRSIGQASDKDECTKE